MEESESLLNPTTGFSIQSDDENIQEIRRGISPLAATSNLCLGVLGAGQLTLPYAMKGAGLGLGLVYLVILGIFAVIVLEMLASVARYYPSADGYGDILHLTIGPKWGKLANVMLGLYTWGCSISYFIVIKQEWQSLSEKFDLGICGICLLCISSVAIVYPLSLFRDFSSLKFTSFLGAFGALYVTFTVLFEAPWGTNSLDYCNGNQNSPDSSVKFLPPGPIAAVNSVPLIAFALNSAWCYVAILAQTKTVRSNHAYLGEKQYEFPSEFDVQTTIIVANVVILINYFLLSIVGYLSYCDETDSNILQNLPNSPVVLSARCLLICQLSLAVPLSLNVTRSILYSNWLEPNEWVPKWEGETKMKAMGVHVGITSLILFSALGLAIAVDSLDVVVALTSSICASGIIYIFPALCYRYYVDKNESLSFRSLKKNLPLGLVVFGFVMLVLGVGATVIGEFIGAEILDDQPQ